MTDEIRFEDLKGKEELFVQAERNHKVHVKADRSLSYGTVIETLDLLNRMGIESLGMITDTSGSTNPLTFIIASNRNITANFSQRIYTWNQSGTAAFSTASNWTPARAGVTL